MESLEFNKIAAGILVALLLVVGIGKAGNLLYAPELPQHAAVETEGDAHSTQDVGGGNHGDAMPQLSLAALLAGADLEDGEGQFRKCKSCHTIEEGGANGTGPNLWATVGAPKEHVAGFNYSGALATAGGDWTFEAIDAFLENPKAYAPGTKMTFRGISDAEDRANLIAWLNTQSNAPLPLPEVEATPADASMDDDHGEADMSDGSDAMSSDDMASGAMSDDSGDTADDITGEISGAAAAMEAAGEMADSAGDAVGNAADEVAELLESDTDVAGNADAGLANDAGAPGGVAAMIAAASAENGESVARKCKSCHTFEEGGANRVGPHLWNVVDRKIGSVEDYSYSDAMASQEGDWTYDRLWTYLQNPKADVPGTKMGFRGITDEADLADLIAYLRTLSNNPAPLAAQ